MTKFARPAKPVHRPAMRASSVRLARARLLAGVSLTALAAASVLPHPARAGQPPMFSAQWFAARSQGASAAAAASGAAGSSAVLTQQQARQSIADLTKMAAALKAAQAFQATAAASRPVTPIVPDGLVAGGLAVAPAAISGGALAAGNTLWIGASLPAQTASAGHTTVTVTQTQPQALLTWQSLNVGANTTLAFDQTTNGGSSAANWVALNKIPASIAPSQILGKITAAGKVYLINQSGILFGAGSQVNVNSLIAAAADLPASITPGLNGGASSVAFSLYGAQSGATFAASFLNAPVASTIDVEPGAQIATALPAAATSGGGYVMLLGGTARNAGSISTPDGQTVLASGQNFILRQGYSTQGNQTATTRGSQVATAGLAGSTENSGIITATDGDVSLIGHRVLQSGVALATTSVNVRGSVHLLSDTADTTATITLAPGSITTVLPDDSQTTALNSQRTALISQSATLNAQRSAGASASNPQVNNAGTLGDRLDLSRIEITTGGAVEFASGSLTMAQGGQLAVQAGGRIQTDTAAALDVSGQLNVVLPMAANELAISVQSFEQRDAPVNRLAGSLNSTTITLDLRDLVLVPASSQYSTDRYYSGGGLLEVSGYLNTTGHTIGEWTALGGSIAFAAKEVVAQSNSTFNIAGGSLSYQAGTLQTTYLKGADGQIYNANTAPATVQYTGIYTGDVIDHSRWNVTEKFANPMFGATQTYQAGYVAGRDAGSLTISAPTVIFEGTLSAGAVSGPYQNTARPASITDGYAAAQNMVAQTGTLALGQYAAGGLAGAFSTSVVLENAVPALADSLSLATAIPAARVSTAWLSAAALSDAGLGGLSIVTSNAIRVADPIGLAPGGSVSLVAPTVDLAASVTARGGTVSAGNVLVTQLGGVTRKGLGTLSTALVTLEAGASIDTRGVWTNARLDSTLLAGQAYVNGGSVTFDSTGRLALAAGSLIDASAGAALLASGKLLGGSGGSVLLTGNDPSLASGKTPGVVSILGTLRSNGVSGGGTFKLVGQSVVISNTQPAAASGQIWLTPDFFTAGFATYDVTGLAGVAVAAGTSVEPVAPVFQLTAASSNVPTGSDPSAAMQLWQPPLYIEDRLHATLIQRQGVSLFLRADANAGTSSAIGGTLTIGDGALLAVDPGQSVKLEALNQITVTGTLSAPGGSIAVVNMRQENYTLGLPSQYINGLSIWLGAQSVLDASAQAATGTDLQGRGFGVVRSGGTVILGSYGGSQTDGAGSFVSTDAQIIVRPGAVIDVSGASASIDPAAGTIPALGSLVIGGGVAAQVASDGGTVSLSSYNGIYLDGILRANAGGAGALGGTLALTLEAPLFAANAATQPAFASRQPRVILVSQDTTSDLGTATLQPGGLTPNAVRDQARISAAQIASGGFANVSLFARDVIAFDGSVALAVAGSVKFFQGVISDTQPTASVSVSAPYVLFSGFTAHAADNAVTGISVNGSAWQPSSADSTATLSIAADLIDISNDIRFGVQGTLDGGAKSPKIVVGYDGFAAIGLNSSGDIRFNTSSFVTPGSLTFTAAQLYPTTQASATVYAGVDYYQPGASPNLYARGNTLTVAWNGRTASLPYSAGGTLVLAAPTVEQGGVVRAPEGNITLGAVIDGPAGSPANQDSFTSLVELRPGSVTSVSAAGQIVPFGGSADNQTYTYNGQTVGALTPGITVAAQSAQSDNGATLDISGGGTLSGAVFQTGRGGSVDTLLQPLSNFTGTALVKATLTSRPVYAIIPGCTGGYAPIAPLDQASNYAGSVPATGAQITLTSSADGLAAGTYTLLPAYYALLPGAFRVELNTAARAVTTGAEALPGGSFTVGGYTGIANTPKQSAIAIAVTLTPGSVVRTYSQYAETSFSQFQTLIAASTGAPRAAIPADAKRLTLLYPSAAGIAASLLPALSYAGVSDFAPASGGYGSTVVVEGKSGATSLPDFEIVAPGATATANFVSISSAALDALEASRLVIGGTAATSNNAGAPTVTFSGQSGSVTLRPGADIVAPEVFLVASAVGGSTGAITVESGATINTAGAGAPPYDSSNGYYYNSFGYTVLAASNGHLNFTPDTARFKFFGAINIADGARLTTAGTLAFSTTKGLALGAHANYGAKYLTLDVASVNIVSTTVQNLGARVSLPPGLLLSQDVLDTLLKGDPASGVPGVTELTLNAAQSVNLFGGVALNTGNSNTGNSNTGTSGGGASGGGLQQFVLNTPAIYGWSGQLAGAAPGPGDVASISTGSGTLVWNGIASSLPAGSGTQLASALPGGMANTGLATGTGTLEISAGKIVLGYPAGAQSQSQVQLDRIITGFQSVVLSSTQAIEGNNSGALAVYATPAAMFGQPGSGGDLTLNTPLLTGQAGALLKLTAGGNVLLTGAGATSASAGGLGAQIDLTGGSITLASTVALPSGRFTATAQTGISLSAQADLALGGLSTKFFDQTNDGAGGSVALSTAAGDVRQASGSTIDISAGKAAAGNLSIAALGGTVALSGTVRGTAASGHTQGSIDIRAASLPSFAALNTQLTAGGITAARAFEIGSGDLTVGNELIANTVKLALDGGSLTITGTIDASGATPGSIDLAAQNGVTLASGALLDAHATVLHTDSYGAPIDAENAPHVTVTAAGGTLSLQSGSKFDVRSADGIARGHIDLNAPQSGSNDIAIAVGGSLSIAGIFTATGAPSGSLALYGWLPSFAAPADAASGTSLVTQSWLDGINAATVAPYMAGVNANAALQARLQPLRNAAQGAFHLRPGVQVVSSTPGGGLTVAGDLNLAGYRYGAGNVEAGALVLRASGSLTVNGSVTDGFAQPVDTTPVNPDDKGWVLFAGAEPFGADVVLPMQLPGAIVLGKNTQIPTRNDAALNYPITIKAATLNQNVVIPAAVTLDPSASYTIPAGGWVVTAAIHTAHGVIPAGTLLAAGSTLEAGATLDAGSVLPFQVKLKAGQVWPAGASLRTFNDNAVTLAASQTLPGGGFIPSGATVVFADASSKQNLRAAAASGAQGQIWATAAMLPAGSQSWSIGLVSGAATAAANRFTVQTSAALGGGGNMVLSDLHYTAPNKGAAGVTPSFSVIRTGQGDLSIAAGGDITQYSLYGIYTAGTQSAAIAPAFQLPQAGAGDGTVLGAKSAYNAYTASYQAYYPVNGGNVLVAAQGGLYGDIYGSNSSGSPASDWVGNWLWRQGTGNTAGVAAQSTAWWINFGSYVLPQIAAGTGTQAALTGFTGIGTLGGGNLTVLVGGDAGVTVGRDSNQRSQGLDLAVASTGRVTSVSTVGGAVSGGTLTLRIGGTLNSLDEGNQGVSYDGLNGTVTDLRGGIAVQAGQIGRIVYQYGSIDPVDTRPLNPYNAGVAIEQGGLIVVAGDAQVQIGTLRDLVLAGAGDAGRLPTQDQPGFTDTLANGKTLTAAAGGVTAFSLWTQQTSITLESLGGNVTPTTQPLYGALGSGFSNDMPTDSRFVDPATLNVIADSGSIYYGTLRSIGTSMNRSLELAPAANGQLQLLAQGSIYAAGYSIDMSGANANSNLSGGTSASALPNPFLPAYTANATVGAKQISVTNTFIGATGPYSLFAFAADTPADNLHANDTQPARIYAASGDIVDFRTGEILNFAAGSGITPTTWYIAAKSTWILAGRDIVASGTRPSLDPANPALGSTVFANEQNQAATANPSAISSGNLIMNSGTNDISLVSAGRDILSSYFYIAGPGLLEVDAGGSINQLDEGMLKSIGPVYNISAQNRDGGAAITALAGTGGAGIDAAGFASLYMNAANLADPNFALTAPQNSGKVAVTYASELLAWLQRTYGYTGTQADALAYFLALPVLQQDVFARRVFFEELKASGREATSASSRRYHSYVRGTEAMYALLPWTPAPSAATDPNAALDSAAYDSVVPASVLAAKAAGSGFAYSGDVTMYSGRVTATVGGVINNSATGQPVVFDAGISTQFGGDIQVLAPGGQVLLGLSGGLQPGSNTGLITFGSGNIAAFARGSVVLGQSRVFTTYGGNIQLWSATGDVNAGIGTKTSVVYQPPSITYDQLGDLTLAPTAPTNGAGIATLSSVPGIPAGDVDLVAPQGTIDAGEAGIRVSGNLTLAALSVSNANNLSVGGKTAGAPAVAVSNVGALQAAASTSGAAQSAASGSADEQRRKRQAAEASVIVVEVLGFGA